MSNDDIYKFKVAMCGPSRVGKTSLITAILEESQKILAGTPISIEPIGTTLSRINQQINALRGSILSGEFNPGALRGTQDATRFELDLKMTIQSSFIEQVKSIFGKDTIDRKANSIIRWAILDYPGAWLELLKTPPEFDKWIKESNVLLVPIDAAVTMEVSRPKEIQARQFVLQIAQTVQLARKWSKERNEKKESGLMILAPVKGESYFKDNGGNVSKKDELFATVKTLYGDLIQAVQNESKNATIKIEYHPIDTIGCVEIKSSHWKKADDNDNTLLEFSADYIVRQGKTYSPFAAGDLLISICKYILESRDGKGVGNLPILKWLDNISQFRDEIEKIVKSDIRRKSERIRNTF